MLKHDRVAGFKVTASTPMHMHVDINYNCMASEMCSGGAYNYLFNSGSYIAMYNI